MKAKRFFIVVRGRKSVHHKAPFHKVIVCTRKHTADWESHRTSEGHTVFVCLAPDSLSCANWLCIKYNGYDIDYRHVTANFKLYDGKETNEITSHLEIAKMLNKAIWWSYDPMPDWFNGKGVKYAKDNFTKQRIWEDSGTVLMTESKSEHYKSKRNDIVPDFLIQEQECLHPLCECESNDTDCINKK